MPLREITIAIDCDDVCAIYEPELVNRLNQVMGTGFQHGDLTPFPENWRRVLTARQYRKAYGISIDPEFIVGLDLEKSAYHGLIQLSQLGAKAKMVTHRHPGARERTESWLQRVGIEQHFADLCLVGGKSTFREKGEFCREIGARYLVDDAMHNAKSAAECGVHTFLVNRPWNTTYQGDPRTYTRVAGLKEAVDLILERF